MRLSLDVIEGAPRFTNAIGDRELDLRGLKISAIENLSATRDLFDTIDLCSNEIKRLENIPPLPRLKMLLLANNRISKIDPLITQRLPSLQILVLAHNEISELSDLTAFSGWRQLRLIESIVLIDNPVSKRPNYRLFLIALLPSLKVIDYLPVTLKERKEAAKLNLVENASVLDAPSISKPLELSEEQREQLRTAISRASSLDEVRMLEQALASGHVLRQ